MPGVAVADQVAAVGAAGREDLFILCDGSGGYTGTVSDASFIVSDVDSPWMPLRRDGVDAVPADAISDALEGTVPGAKGKDATALAVKEWGLLLGGKAGAEECLESPPGVPKPLSPPGVIRPASPPGAGHASKKPSTCTETVAETTGCHSTGPGNPGASWVPVFNSPLGADENLEGPAAVPDTANPPGAPKLVRPRGLTAPPGATVPKP